MLETGQITQLAKELHDAEKNRQQIPAISQKYPDITMEDGYAIQKAWMDIKTAEGKKVIGYKVGLTSRANDYAN